MMGLPCVATRHAGIPETVPNENKSLLAAEGNIAQISAAMRSLITGRAEEIEAVRVRGREYVKKHFSIQSQAETHHRIYSEILSQRH